jgi:hypothetical protein
LLHTFSNTLLWDAAIMMFAKLVIMFGSCNNKVLNLATSKLNFDYIFVVKQLLMLVASPKHYFKPNTLRRMALLLNIRCGVSFSV